MHGKQLSALLQILRAHGVTRYATDKLTLDLGPAPAKQTVRGAIKIDLSPEALDADRRGAEVDDDDPGDMRFGLEKLTERWFPAPRATPRKNKAPR